ncbi:hypothetical protein GCM10027589_31000 [Actinocorallia lasiicapitis]
MRGVMRRIAGSTGDRGAMAPLIALLLAGGVFLGLAAIVVDVGRVYAEREELQSGADAAALAVALRCAKNGCGTDDLDTLAALAKTSGEANASDGAVSVRLVCGKSRGTELTDSEDECDAPAENATGCVGERPAGNYVEYETSTANPDDSTLLPYSFAQSFAGEPGVTVGACARAGWGGAKKAPVVIPFMLSKCQWDHLAATKPILDKPEDVFNPPPGGETQLHRTVTGVGGCGRDDNITMLVGGDLGDCAQQVAVGDTVLAYTEIGVVAQFGSVLGLAPCQIRTLQRRLRELFDQWIGDGKSPIMYVPVYEYDSAGFDWEFEIEVIGIPIFHYKIPVSKYKIIGYAPFVPTGGSVGFHHEPSWVRPGRYYCGTNLTNPRKNPFHFAFANLTDPCLTGYFVRDVVSGPYTTDPAADFGLTSVQLAG